MGRIDTQVKLRGFRIELGEIESKALNIEGIKQAAAEVRKVMGNEHLVLYYTVVDGSDIDDESLRAALAASSLAEYMVPYDALSETFEFSPIDDVAHAIMLLATTPKECTVFHPYNIHHLYFADILNGFADAGITLKRVEREEFQEALQQMMDNPDLVTLLRPLMAYNLSTTHQMRWIEADNDYTTQVLYRYGFQWPTTARNYVHRFVDTIVAFDYF